MFVHGGTFEEVACIDRGAHYVVYVVYTCVLEVNTKSDYTYTYQLLGKPHMFWYQTKVLTAFSKES